MKENKYDNDKFFNEYSKMTRSTEGLKGAGEWHELKKMLPNFNNKDVLDLGCGFGWHCKYAVQNGAKSAIGIDLSEKMINRAIDINNSEKIQYRVGSIEDYDYPENSFDIVISSLAFHYVKSFDDICSKVYKSLNTNGKFVFSVEHPIFTAEGTEDWWYNNDKKIHWPVDNYFSEGIRKSKFLGEEVIKYHKTLTTYINGLLKIGFKITKIIEPMPELSAINKIPEMKDELRRPMMLLISAEK